MPNYPESGIKLVADTADYTTAMNDAIFLADYFDSLGTIAVDVVADVDTSALEGADFPTDGEQIDITIQADLTGDDMPLDGETINYTVEADVEGDLADLPLEGETVNFTAKGELEGAVVDLPKDGSEIGTTVDVKETETAAKTLSAMETLKNLEVMETVWNIAGTAVDILKSVGEFAVKPMLDLDSAVARVNAQTGGAIPNAKELIKNIFYDDLGDSIDQVAKLTTKAAQMKIPIDEAVRSALTFTHTFQDENPEEVLDTLNQMVITKLAPNFTVAGDMITRAFQNGANRGGDLLKAVGDNANAIADLGLDGPEALAFIKTGMDNGFKSANDVLSVLLKIKQNVANAAGNADSDVSKTLKTLGIANPAETGEAWSAEFFESVIDKIKTMPGLTDTEREQLFSNLAGGKQGGKVFSSFMEISAEDADGIFKNVAGAAERAATEADNSFSGAIDDFIKEAERYATEFLSSSAIDLPGKLDALKTGLQDGLNALADGGTLGEALTVALKPIGFDDEFQGLESALGTFVIGILQAVAFLQSLDPANWEAKKGTDALIAQQGATQLAFDLKVGNPDEVAGELAIAVSRGVTPEKIAESVGTAVNELIAQGQPALAQSLLDAVKTAQADANANVQLTGSGSLMNVEPTVTPEAIDALQAKIDAAQPVTVTIEPTAETAKFDEMMNAITFTADKTIQPISDVNTQIATTGTNATTATTAVSALNTQTETQGNNSGAAAPKVQQTADATKKLGDNAGKASSPVGDVSGAMDRIAMSAPAAAAGLSAADLALQQIITTANGLAAANDAVAQKQGQLDAKLNDGSAPVTGHASGTGSALGTFMTGEQGRELVTSNRQLAVLNNMTTEAIMSALNGYIPSGSSSQSSGRGVVVNNTNIVQSEAQADAVGYGTAQILRGMN